MLIEPIQGESGVWPTSDEALLAARQACDEAGALLIFDEIQTGIGRTGSLWAYEQTPVRPGRDHQRQGARQRHADRRLHHRAGGGRGAAARAITARPSPPGRSRTSAALAVLDAVDDPALLRSVRELGARLRSGLEELPGVVGTRGRGLMVGVALDDGIDAAALGADLLERGLVVNVRRPGTLRLLPPLVVEKEQIDRAVGLIGESLLGFVVSEPADRTSAGGRSKIRPRRASPRSSPPPSRRRSR